MPILNDIIDWVENKPIFWQIAIDRLIRNNNLTNIDISELKEICKVDFGLSIYSFTPVDFVDLRRFVSSSISADNVSITEIRNIENINALSNANILEFALQGLTVVYGDNGSGKSSYVSILKHVCNTRGNKPTINGNLYNSTTYNNDKKAEVEFTKDGVSYKSVLLVNEEIDDLTLKSVDVFDTSSADHYIEKEDEIAFIPHGLALVEKFALAIKKIENALNSELQSPSLVQFNYLQLIEVPNNSNAQNFLNNLNSNTTRNELRAESEWNKTKGIRLTELKEIIPKLKTTDPKKELKKNEDRVGRFKILRNKFEVLEDNLSGDLLDEIKVTINEYVNAKQALKDASEKAFDNLLLSGVGNQSWLILWESARKYYNESKKQNIFPEVDGNCPLCLQELAPEAKIRFTNFEEFVKNDIQTKCNQATDKFELLMNKLNGLSIDFREQEPIITELDELSENFNVKNDSYVAALNNQKEYLIGLLNTKSVVETISDLKIETNSRTTINKLINELETSNEKLKSQSIEEVLKPLVDEQDKLLGEKKIYDHWPKLGREIYRQKKVGLLNSCIGKCNTRTITILSNELTTSYVSHNLKDNFKLELRKLGFNYVKIDTETKGARGKQYHYLKLNEPNSSSVSLKDILSEGEHRCISLATFLSELSLSEHNSSIIFDDPVSSLDHKWRNRIAKRIAEEANQRQVIVFTHDITFLMMLQEHSKNMSCSVVMKSLTRKKTETGIIASNPPWDALKVKTRIGILKNLLVILEKIEKNETEEVYNESVKPFYGKLRETWERFVEEVLLNKVIQRFGREIQTQRLKLLSDLTEDDYNIIEINMKKCSTYLLGHDSSGTLIENMPNSTEIKNDLKVIEDYLTEMRKRKRQ